MKLGVLSNYDRILEAQKSLVKRFQDETPERIRCSVRHRGTGSPGTASNEPVDVLWAGKLWFDSREHQPNRYWNVFGVKKPREDRPVSPDCEICVPREGIN